MSGFFVVV